MKAGKTRGAWSAHWSLFSLATMVSLSWLSAERSMALDTMPTQEPRIEIAIRNSTYMRTKTVPIRAEMPMVLVIRNEDPIPHGFISPMFSGSQVTVETGGVEVFGRNIEGVHVAPGQTAVIRLTPGRQGKVSFRCDLHPNVEGELYLLDVPVG